MITMKAINKGYMLGEERLPILKELKRSVKHPSIGGGSAMS